MKKHNVFLVLVASLLLLPNSVCADFVDFVSPTPQNGDPISNPVTIKMSIDSAAAGAFIDWDSTLAGWWNFENHYEDSSTYSHKSYCIECPTLEEAIHGHAYDFNGDRDQILIEGADLNLGPNITISMWVNLRQKPDTDPTTKQDEYHNLIDQFDPGGYLLRVLHTGQLVSYPRRDGDGYYISVNSGYYLEWEKTYHIVYQITEIDSSHSMITYYVNGQRISNHTLSYHVGGTGRRIYIGSWGRSAHRSTYGLIDDVMLFKRILSPDEIMALYSSGSSLEARFSASSDTDHSFYGCATDSQGLSHCTEIRILSNGMPPAISNLAVQDVTSQSVTITWETDLMSDSVLEFGTGQSYGYMLENNTLTTQHKISLTRLKRGTTYHFRVRSTDISGDSAYSPDYTVITNPDIEILPKPQKLTAKGFYVSIDGWHIETHSPERYRFSAEWLQNRTQHSLPITNITHFSTNRILLGDVDSPYVRRYLQEKAMKFPDNMSHEGYVLEVFPHEIVIAAKSPAGVFYGVQTLLQLLKYDNTVEAVSVKDWPDNRIRGFVVVRAQNPLYIGHKNGLPCFTQEQKDYIDKLAQWKINTVLLFERDGYTWKSDMKYMQPYIDMKNYMKKRFIDLIPTVGALKDFSHVPFYLGDGWYVQDEEFYFDSDDRAQAVKPFQNMIPNSGFEDTLDGWEVTGNAEVTTEEKHTGQYSVKVSKGYLYVTFPVQPGEIYHLAGYGRGGYPEICIYSQDENYNTNYATCDYTKTVPVNYWRRFGITIRANNETRRIKVVMLSSYGHGYSYFDDIMLFRLNGALKNVIRTKTTDIKITNLDKTITYREGIDYKIINGTTAKIFLWDLQPFAIERIPGGAISENQHVLVSYDFITYYKYSSPQSIPLCISDERVFTEYYYPAIERMVHYLKPKILMFRGDETRGFNRDSRDVKRGVTNAELYAEWVNKLNAYTKSQDPNCRIMIWDDMVSPYHNGGIDYQVYYGGPFGKTGDIIKNNMISNDVIMDVWWYEDDYLTQMHQATDLFASNGFDYVGSPWYNLENIKSWSEILVNRPHSLGGLDTDWGVGNIEAHYPYFADHIWNTRNKIIFFSSFEKDFDKNDIPDGWELSGNLPSQPPNLLLNPSFESGFDNWSIIHTDDGTPEISNVAYSGANSAHFKSSSESTSSVITTDYYIRVEPNKRYIWSGCGKTDNVITGKEGHHKLYGTGRFLNDSYQRPYADGRYFLDIRFDAGTHDWQCVSYEKRAPEDAVYFKVGSLGLLGTGTGEGWIDNLSFRKYVPPFYSCNRKDNQGKDVSHTSVCAVSLNNAQTLQSMPIRIVPGKKYVLSLFVKKEDITQPSDYPKIYLDWYDAQDHYIASSEKLITNPNESYTRQELEAISPPNANMVRIRLTGCDQFFWFDTVSLKEEFTVIPSCGNGICEYPENQRNCEEDCILRADKNKNGCVETGEIYSLIKEWLRPADDIIALKDIIRNIKSWKES